MTELDMRLLWRVSAQIDPDIVQVSDARGYWIATIRGDRARQVGERVCAAVNALYGPPYDPPHAQRWQVAGAMRERQRLLEVAQSAAQAPEEASARQLSHGFGETIAQHYHAQATRLDLAATVLLGAIQLTEDELAEALQVESADLMRAPPER